MRIYMDICMAVYWNLCVAVSAKLNNVSILLQCVSEYGHFISPATHRKLWKRVVVGILYTPTKRFNVFSSIVLLHLFIYNYKLNIFWYEKIRHVFFLCVTSELYAQQTIKYRLNVMISFVCSNNIIMNTRWNRWLREWEG